MRELFESTIERLLGDLATSEYVLGCEGGTWPAELWAAVEESGFTLAAIPEPLGGADAGWSDLYVLARAAGRFAAPIPLGEALLGNWLLGQVGLEGHGGVLSIAADARLSLRGGTVEGVLHDVPWGRHSEAVVAIAEEDGIPSVVLLARAEAVEQSLGLNVAGEPRDDLHFSSAPVLACAPLPLGIPAEALLLGGALLRSAQIAGASLALLEMTSSYASERSQFGRPIGAFRPSSSSSRFSPSRPSLRPSPQRLPLSSRTSPWPPSPLPLPRSAPPRRPAVPQALPTRYTAPSALPRSIRCTCCRGACGPGVANSARPASGASVSANWFPLAVARAIGRCSPNMPGKLY